MKFSAMNNLPFFAPEGDGGGAPGSAAPSGEPSGNPPSGSETWYGKAGVGQEHHEWLASKQFDGIDTALKSYRSLEGIVGRQRLAVPKDADDADAYNAIYKTLGRPETADKYTLPKDSKISGDEWKTFAPVFHEAGLSQAQTERILTSYEKRAGELREAAETERANEETRQIEKLTKEWGSNHDGNQDIAARAFRALGIDEATSDAIEGAIGYYATMKLFHSIGAGMGEARLLQDGNKGGAQNLGGNLEAEKNKLNDKFKDKAFMERYMHHDPRVRKEAIDEVEGIQKRIAELTAGNG